MSPARVLIVVAFAAALCVAAFFVLRNPPTPTSDGAAPVLQFDPARAQSLTVTRPGGAVETVRRGTAPGEWVVELAQGGSTSTWPANPNHARPAFQLISNIVPVRMADAGATLPADATRVSVALDNGTTVSMRLDSTVLAGAVLAVAETPVPGKAAWVESILADMLVKAGPREWRSRLVFPGVSDAARVTLRSGSTTISLARVQGRWHLREPLIEVAEPDAVVRLAESLARVEIADFLDAGPPAATGLDSPAATVVLETDLRDPETGQSTTVTSSLHLGHPADMGAKSIFARLTRAASERVVTVNSEHLDRLSRDPAMFVSRRAVAASAADVGGLEVGERRFTRTIDGWRALRDGTPVPAESDDPAGIEALLALLTGKPAETVQIGPAAPGGVRVQLTTIGGEPIGTVTVDTEPDPTPGARAPFLVVRSEKVTRRYPAVEATALWPWLSSR